MSRTLLRRAVLAATLLAATFACGRLAVAGTASLEDLLAGGLTPSAAPALLGPITSAGRVGWECKPERAAAAARWHEGELPTNPGTP
ncbi:MAG: hypothetical protein WCC84_01290 [Candidatus Cybelea sp.]